MLQKYRELFFNFRIKFLFIIVFVVAVFSFGNGHFSFVKALGSQINIFPSNVEEDGVDIKPTWQATNNVFNQDLGANALYEEFNVVNSLVIDWEEVIIDESENGNTEEIIENNDETEAPEEIIPSDSDNADGQENSAENTDVLDEGNTSVDSVLENPVEVGESEEPIIESAPVDNAPSEAPSESQAPATEPAEIETAPTSFFQGFRNGFSKLSRVIATFGIFGSNTAQAELGDSNGTSVFEKSIVFDNFSVPFEDNNEELAKVDLRLSMAGYDENKKSKVFLYYDFSSNLVKDWKALGEYDLSEKLSNATHGGYFSLEIPDELPWSKIKELQIKIAYLSEEMPEENDSIPLFIDALWLEAKYNESGEEALLDLNEEENAFLEEELSPEEEEARRNELAGFGLNLLSQKRDFKTTEMPEFSFRFERKKGIVEKIIDGIVYVFRDEYKDLKISTKIKGLRVDGRENIEPQVRYLDNGEFEVYFKEDSRSFKPGTYVLEISIEDQGETFISRQYFSWGVLAMNVNKSVYKPGEKAFVQMAALNENGDTICDVEYMLLEIRRPDGTYKYISNYNNELIYNPACGLNNVISEPDYYAYFDFPEVGYYDFKLTAKTDNGEFTIAETIEVKDTVAFEIERTGPTRIYPKALYKMVFKVKAADDYSGEFIEKIPLNFGLEHSREIIVVEKENYQELHWSVDFKKDEVYEFSYVFDAPNISPEFYLFGPAKVGEFEEQRQWQIASDMPRGEVGHAYVNHDAPLSNGIAAGVWEEVPEYLIASTTFVTGEKYLLLINFSINNDNANENAMARVRHGATTFTDSSFSWEPQRAGAAFTGNGYQYFTVWTAVAGEDIHIDITNLQNGTVYMEGYQAFVMNLEGHLSENKEWYYATAAHSGDLLNTWSNDGANIDIDGQGHDWLIMGMGNFLVDSVAADFQMRLNNTTHSVTRSDARYQGEDTADYRPIMLMTGYTINGTDNWRVDAQVNTSATHDWESSKIFALDLNSFRDHQVGTSTASVNITPVGSWIQSYSMADYYVPSSANTFVWSNEIVDMAENTKAMYSRIQVDNVTEPVGFEDNIRELPTALDDETAYHNFFVSEFSMGFHTIDVDLQETVDATPNPAADIHNLIAFSMELSPIFLINVLSNEQYEDDATTTIPNGGFSNGDVVLSSIASDVALGTSSADFYIELVSTSTSFRTATTTPASACSEGTDYEDCASKIWKKTASTVPSSWYSGDWQYRKKITLNASQIIADQTNFPVLATTTDLNLRTTGNGGHVASGTGGDILVTDSDGVTLLNFEREYYASSTGQLAMWIKTNISSSTNKDLYIYYGNSVTTNDKATSTGVWDANYKGVWHLGETGTGLRYDSTMYRNNGTTNGFEGDENVVGPIGRAQDFDGTNDYINAGTTIGISGASARTLSGWARSDGVTGTAWTGIFGQQGASANYNYFDVEIDGANNYVLHNYGTQPIFRALDTNWHYFTATYNGTSEDLYVDGAFVRSLTVALVTPANASFIMGTRTSTANEFNGQIDEVRISNNLRSAFWTTTEYRNQNNVNGFMNFAGEESLVKQNPQINLAIDNLTDGGEYKWQTLVCDSPGNCSAWSLFSTTTPNIKVDNTNPTAPGNLSLLSRGSRSITLDLGYESVDLNFDKYRIFYKASTTGVTESDIEHLDTNLNYINYNGANETTINDLMPDTDYVFNIWAYDLGGNKMSATEVAIRTLRPGRAKTVQFMGGTYNGNGTTGQLSDTEHTFSSFNFKLVEDGVSIENAYIIFESAFESYNSANGTYSGYSLSFDTCQAPCTVNAWTGSGKVGVTDGTVLAYDEGEGNMVRLLVDVTEELQLKAYNGTDQMDAQIGYRLNSDTTANSISAAKATLVVTYTYDEDSPSLTNTVVYPLESTNSGDNGSRKTVQADDCTLNGNCPLFSYNMDLPEYISSPAASRLSQWFSTYNHNDNNDVNDISIDVNIQGNNTNSNTYIHEAGNDNDVSNIMGVFFSGVAGYNENTNQQLEYHATTPTVAASHYLLGGEVFETYTASSSASIKTRTASFPIGVVSNGLSNASSSAGTNVFFPENGTSGGKVTIKKAWLRVKTSRVNNAASTLNLTTKVGETATSGISTYNFLPSVYNTNPTINIIHILDSGTYEELELANGIEGVLVNLTAQTPIANPMGLSAELMITYTYSSEESGYLSSLSLFAGQPQINGNAQNASTSVATIVMPEGANKTLLGAAVIMSALSSDSDGGVSGVGDITTFDVNISTSTPICTNAYEARSDDINGFKEFYKSVAPSMDTEHGANYQICFSNNGGTDPTGGAKMNGQLTYTYQFFDPPSVTIDADNQRKSNNFTPIANGGWTEENEVYLSAFAEDSASTTTEMDFYFELIGAGSAYATSTGVPSASCSSGTAFGACASKKWKDTFAGTESAAWYDTDWLYRKKLTINADQVIANQNDFVVLATTTDLNLAFTANGGHMASSSGGDIAITDSDGTTLLDFEREYYNSASGQMVLWIKTDISSTTNKDIYLYYGNEAQVNDLSNGSNVWDTNFNGVWHLNETGTGAANEYLDSSINTNNGQGGSGTAGRVPTRANGWIGYGQSFDGAGANGDYIDCGNNATINGAKTEVTVEAWIRHTVGGGDGHIAANGGGWGQNGFSTFWYTNHLRTEFNGSYADDTLLTDNGRWNHMVLTWDADTDTRYVYINGVRQSLATYTGAQINVGAVNFNIGRMAQQPNGYLFNGIIDEVRVSSSSRSDGWVRTQYNNQKDASGFVSFSTEETHSAMVYPGTVHITSIPDSTDGYKWQVLGCNNNDICSSWNAFDVSPNFKVDNTPPTLPGNLSLATSTPTSVTLNFGSPSVESNFLYYKIFYKSGISDVSTTDNPHPDSNLNFINYNGATSTLISDLEPYTQYVFNIWAYDLAGNIVSATELPIVTPETVHSRGSSVRFVAGTYTGNGTTGQNSNTNQTLSSFNYKLAESGVKIENAFVIFEAQYMAYAPSIETIGYELAFDSCVEPCSANAWSGAGALIQVDDTMLSYAETESNQVRLLFDVTDEAQLDAYSGGSLMEAQVGYNLKHAVAQNSIANVKSWLVVTYSYDGDNSKSYTNTVAYPLKSNVVTDSGTRQARQTDDCVLNSTCPIFDYNVSIPEISEKLDAWFQTYSGSEGNSGSDNIVNVNIQGVDVNSNTVVHEAFNGATQGIMPTYIFKNVFGYAENTAQQLEYRAICAGTASYDIIGGEVYETYTASTSAPIKTRTVVYPIGVVDDGRNINLASSSVDVYFPENGDGSGIVDVKSAWFRVHTNYRYSANATMGIASKVGASSTSAFYNYFMNTGDSVPSPSVKIIHVIGDNDYDLIEVANKNVPVNVTLFNQASSANWGGVSAELVITYTYTDESSGYLSSLDIYGGQSTTNSNSTSISKITAKTVFPELRGTEILRGASLNSSYLLNASDGTMPANVFLFDSSVAVTGVSCVDSHSAIDDGTNAFIAYYKDVTDLFSTTDNQAYEMCMSISSASDVNAGAKMNSIISYTYQWEAPPSEFTQSDWRWYANYDGVQPTLALANENTAISNVSIGDTLRLRFSMGITREDLVANTQTLKLQYGKGSDCTMVTEWSDVGPLGGNADWIAYNNPNPIDGDNLNSLLLASSTVLETYEESNPSVSNPNTIAIGDFGEWDWAIYNKMASSSDYCFRMIKANGVIFDDYLSDSYPKVGTAPSNTKPNTPINLGQYRSNGTTVIPNSGWINDNNVLLRAAATDPNINETVTLYFELKTSSESFTTATSQPSGACVYGTAYNSCASKIWFAAPSMPGDFRTNPFIGTTSITAIATTTSDYKWQVISCDDDGYCSSWVNPGLSPNFKIDTQAPTRPGNMTFASSSPTAVTLNFGATTTELNFAYYKIFYRLGSSGVGELDNQHTDTNLNFINYNGSATTTISNLSAGSAYVFNIWAYDLAGNKASATLEVIGTTTSSFTPPTGSIVNAIQKNDGSGAVDIVILVDDLDNDNTLRAKVEYVQGLACDFSTPLDPSLDENDDNITATYGDPDIHNNSPYQVGTSTSWIMTSPGSNYVFFDWMSQANIPNVNDSYCLRLTVNDGMFDQNLPLSTRTVLIDNQAPTTPGALTLNKKDYDSVSLRFGSQSTDPVFDRYRIFYKKATSSVSVLDFEHSDPNLLDADYKLATTTEVTGLEANTLYYFNIWAYDDFGNKASSTEISVKTNAKPINTSADQQYESPTLSIIPNGNWSSMNDLIFRASTHDQDSADTVSFYYQVIGNASAFSTSQNVPSGACNSTVAYADCASKIWVISTTTSELPLDWYDGDWLYRKSITVEADNVPVSYNDFPLLATTSGSEIASKARSDGHDIIFTDSDGVTLLNFERESYNSVSGALSAWVSVDISSTTDKTIYMYYGNNSHASDLSTTTNIWDANYRGVWHLGDFVVDESYQADIHFDSTANNNAGSQYGNNELISKIAYGQEFDGNDYISVDDHNSLDIVDQISMETWVKSQVSGSTWNYSRNITLSTSTKQDDFQVRLNLSSATFNYANAKADGSDLRFYDANGNPLNYWIESWNIAGNSSIWIKIPSTGTNQILMKYGNPAATAVTNISGVMDAGNLRYFYYDGMAFNTYQGTDLDNVLNIPNTAGTVMVKGNTWENQAESLSIRWQGFIKRANTGVHTFWIGGDDGDRVYVDEVLVANDWSDHGYRELSGTRTFVDEWESIRFEFYENGGGAQALLQWDPGTGRVAIPAENIMNRKYEAIEPTLSLGTEKNIGVIKNGAYGISFGDAQIIASINSTKATTSINTAWNHIAMTYDRTAGSNQLKLYVNGVLAKTATLAALITSNSENLLIGDMYSGNLDELRISNVARDSNRILTEYRNQNGALVSYGAETRVQSYYETNLVLDITDSSTGYKWQAMACDDDGDCSAWSKFNNTIPNFKIDATDPTAPGQLTESTKSSNQITLAFGAQTTESNFARYRIFYSTTTPPSEADIEHDDASLLAKNYDNELYTTVYGLLPDTTYYFNIWAYDLAGRKASSSISTIATLEAMSSPGATFYTKGTRVLYYRVWNGTQWLAEQTGPTFGSAAGDNIRHIRTQRSDDGGKIAVFAKTYDGANSEWWGTVYSFVADSFTPRYQFGGASAGDTNPFLISGCIASLSGGEFMVITADNDANGDTDVYSWNGLSDWVPEGNGPYTSNTLLAACKLVRRPGTDNYLAVMHDDQNDIYTSYYYGGATYTNSWTTVEEHSTNEYDTDNFAGDAFFDPSDNTRGAIQYSNSAVNTYAQAKYFLCDNTSINYGAPVSSPQTAPDSWNTAFVSGEFGVNYNSTGIAYFVGRDTSNQLNVYKVNASNPTITWSTMTGGDYINGVALYDEANNSQLPFAINFYKDNKGVVVWNNNAIGLPIYNTVNAVTNTVSATSSVPGATTDLWTRVRIYDDPGEEEFLAIYQNDNVDYRGVFWDGGSDAFYSSGNQAWTSLASGLTPSDRDDEAISFAFASYNSAPSAPSSLGQYKANTVTVIPNLGWTNESSIHIKANINDVDTEESLRAYLELIANTDTYVSSTTEPFNACNESVSFAMCNSKIWEIASSTLGDYSINPLIATATISGLSNSSIGYKWRVIACDDEGECSAWTPYNTTIPNFKVDTTAPSSPGALTVNSIGSSYAVLRFGSSTVEDNFLEYRIYYKVGSSVVTTGDLLFASTSDPHLANKLYSNAATTTVGLLSSSTLYSFNIWAFDMAGNMASATPQVSTTTKALPNIRQVSYIIENDDGANVNDNSPASTTYEVNLSNVHIGERANVRFQVENIGGDTLVNKIFKLQFDTNENNTWVDVGTSTAMSVSYGLSGANGDIISGTKARANTNFFVNGAWYENTASSSLVTLANGAYTELAFAIKTNNAVNSSSYRFRLYNITDGVVLNTYSLYPQISIEASSTKRYSKVAGSLSSTPVDLTYYFDPLGYASVNSDDGLRDEVVSNTNNPVQYFALKHTNNTDAINVTWNGQSSVETATKKIYLQAYTYGSPNQWTTIASSTTADADSDFSLSAYINSNLNIYYGVGNWTYFRVYQDSGTETLATDYFNASFSAPTPYTSLSHYRWRNDNGTEITASWREGEDLGDPSGSTVNLDKNTNIRLRVAVKNTGAGPANAYNYRLEFASSTGNCSTDPGGWITVPTTTTTHWRMSTSTNIADAAVMATSRLTSDGNTYVSGYTVTHPSNSSAAISLIESRYTELEYNILATNNANTAGTYCFRVTNNGTALSNYGKYPVITLAGNTNAAPIFAAGGYPTDADSVGASDSNSPTDYNDTIIFSATGEDSDDDDYYLAVCKANSITPGNDGPPTCGGAGAWCISGQASSTDPTSCNYVATDAGETLPWYAFICDKRAGFSIAKCSAYSQGTGDPEADSPIVINHPPTYTSVSTLVPNQNPGSTYTIRAIASDSDVSSAPDSLTMYVCATNDATWSGCGGATICSSASSSNPSCNYVDVAPTPSGSVTYYAFVYDNHGLGALSNARSSSYTINNVAPVMGSITLNDGNDISLNIKGMSDTTVSVVSASTVDMNGCTDLVSAVSSVYISNAVNGPICSADNNFCYQITTANCVISDCLDANDTNATVTCTTGLKYFAMPTDDFSNNPLLNWVGYMQVNDGSNMPTATTSPVDILTNMALAVPEQVIDFGSNMYAGDNTGTFNATTTVENAGNSPIDTSLSGTDMTSTGYTINVNNIKWSLSNFSYNTGTSLDSAGIPVDINAPKPTTVTGTYDEIFWGLGIPYGADADSYNGYNTFTVMIDNDGW